MNLQKFNSKKIGELQRLFRLKVFGLFLIGVCSASSCGTESGTIAAQDENNCIPIAKTNGGSLKQIKVNMFLETSGSMAGFMSAKANGTDFQTELWSVVDGLQRGVNDGIGLFQVRSKSEPLIAIAVNDFKKRLNTGGFQSTKSTDIPEMLDSIFTKMGSHTVSVLVSDLIFSPENGNGAQIKQITTDIRGRFKAKNRSSVLIQLKSDFYQKKKIEASPYYIWVIGEQNEVDAVANLIRSLLQTPVNEVDFDLEHIRPKFSILPSISQVPNASPMACPQDSAYYVYSEYSEEDFPDLKFWVGVNLASLPNYMLSVPYLFANLKPDAGAATATVLQVKEISGLKNKDDRELVSRMGLTHMVQISVSQIGETTTVSLTLDRHLPAWIEQFNIEQDDYRRQKTFGLKKMVNGLEDARSYQKNNVFTEPFKIYITK
jgi:hypothetical protein